jgi:hypothetical protein
MMRVWRMRSRSCRSPAPINSGIVRAGNTVRRPLKRDSDRGVRASRDVGDGEPAARMLRVAADAYGLHDSALVDAMLLIVRDFQAVVAPDRGAMDWGLAELAHLERNADLFRARLAA